MRRKMAWVMALSMLISSVPVNSFMVHAEEVIVETYNTEEKITASEELYEAEPAEETAAVEEVTLLEVMDAEHIAEYDMLQAETEISEMQETELITGETELVSDGFVIESIEVEEDFEGLENTEEVVEAEPHAAAENLEQMAASATEIDLEKTSVYDVSIDTEGEMDYFRIMPTVSGKYIFTSFTESGDYLDVSGYLYDGAGQEITYNDDSAGNGQFRIVEDLEAGNTYYLGARMYSGTAVGFYKIQIEYVDLYIAGDTENNMSVKLNEEVTLSVEASSSQTISYQWYKNGELMDQETDAILNLGSVTESATYECEVTVGSYSERITYEVYIDTNLTIDADETIDSVRTAYNGSVQFYVAASADEGVELTYTWYDGYGIYEEVLEEKTAYLNVAEQTYDRHYTCKVEDMYGQQKIVYCYVDVYSLIINEEEGDRDIFAAPNNTVTLSVDAESLYDQEKITYQWYLYDEEEGNYKAIDGETGASYVHTVTKSENVYCLVYDEADSRDVWFYITADTGFKVDYDNMRTEWANVKPGTDITLEMKASVKEGCDLFFEWYDEDENLLEEYAEAAVTFENIQDSCQMKCRAYDGYGNVEEQWFYVHVNTLKLKDDYYNYLVKPETEVVLNVNASSSRGQEALKCTWEKYDYSTGEYETLTETGTSLTIDKVTAKTRYYCDVTDGNESETVWFYVTVNSNLKYSYDEYAEVEYGETAVLSVTASSSYGPVTYQWYLYDYNEDEYVLIEGAAEPAYSVENVTENKEYKCVISDLYKSVSLYFEVYVNNTLHVNYDTDEYYVLPGTVETLTVSAESSMGEITYEWEKYDEDTDTWNLIENANESSILTDAVNCDMGYRCNVSDGYSSRSITFWLYIDTGLDIDYDGSIDVPVNETTVLSVDASTKYGELSYEWFSMDYEEYEWVKEEGADSASFTTPQITAYAEYKCIVSNGYSSREAYFDVYPDSGLIIDEYERYVTVRPGQDAVLTVNASNTAGTDLNYTWYLFDEDEEEYFVIENADGASYTVTDLRENRRYRCTVYDGFVSSNAVFDVEIDSGLTVSKIPVLSAYLNETAELKVIASTNAGSIIYFWEYYDSEEHCWREITDAKTDTMITAPVTEDMEYRCTADDGYETKTVYFDIAVISGLTVNCESSVSVLPGTDGVLTVTAASDNGSLSYQWYVYNEDEDEEYMLYGENSSVLILEKPAESADYYCRVTDGYQVKTAEIRVNVTSGLEYSSISDTYLTAAPNSTVTMAVSATTNDPAGVTYEWFSYDDTGKEEMVKIEGADTGELTVEVKGVQTYYCRISDSYETEYVYYRVWVDSGLVIKMDSDIGVKALVGSNVTLSVDAETSYGPLTYEWGKCTDLDDGRYTVIDGASSRQVVIENYQTPVEYRCKISDQYNSRFVYFYVSTETGFTVNTEDTVIVVKNGESAVLTVDASTSESYGPVEYTWHEWKYDYDDDSYYWEEINASSNSITATNITGYKLYRCEVADKVYSETIQFTVLTEEISAETAVNFEDAKEIYADSAAEAKILIPGTRMYFKFVPEKTGNYVFTSDADHDSYGYLFNAEEEYLTEDDDSGSDMNFMITYDLYAGRTYYLAARYYSSSKTGTFPVYLTYNGDPVIQHHWDNGTITVQPTCTQSGQKIYKCKDAGCQESYTETVAASGHAWSGLTVFTNATCASAGSQGKKCQKCGVATEVTAIPATGKHSYGAYTVTKAPTALAAGVKTRSCKVCAQKDTAAVAKLQPTMTLNASSLTLKFKQKTTALKVTGMAAGDAVASYKSSNKKIFTVSKTGKITAKKKAGSAKLTITLKSGLSKTITVKVQKAEVKTTKISGVSKKVTLKKGKTYTLAPVITPITSVQKVTFTTSNKKVATVSSKGVITAKKKGTAKITVKSGSKKVTCTVKVK